MASPFHVLRKNQKVLMVVLGGLAILTWLVLDAAGPGSGSGGSYQDPIVATTKTQKIRASDLEQLRNGRNLLARFLEQAMLTAYEGMNLGPQTPLMIQYAVEQLLGGIDEVSLVDKLLLVNEAQRLGMIVSDASVTSFLQRVTMDRVTGEQLTNICREVGVSRPEIFNLLRQDLMAQRAAGMLAARRLTTPAERWDYFLRLRQRATAELAPVRVSDFVSQVKDPPEAVLREFFETYKEREPTPGAREPGFKSPEKAAVQYFAANYEKFYDEAAVTDQEIQDYYEANKDQHFLFTDVGPGLDDLRLDTTPAAQPEATPGPVGAPATEGTTETPAAAPGADTSGTGASDATPIVAPATGSDDDNNSNGGSPQAARPPQSVDWMLAFAQDAADAAASTVATDASVSTDASEPAADASAAATSESQADASASSEAPANDSSTASQQTEPTSPTSDRPSASSPELTVGAADAPPAIGSDLMLPSSITAGENPKYDPLWKVSDQIRRDIAREKAVVRMDEVLSTLQSLMRDYARERVDWELSQRQGAAKTSAPAPFDVKKLAQQHGVDGADIPLSTGYELRGESGILSSTVRGRPFVDVVFEELRPYLTERGEDAEGNRYLFWKTEEVEAKVPTFAEAKDEVLRTWKVVEARALARKAADALAKSAQSAKKPLKEAFADDTSKQVIDVGPFSWLSTGSAGMFNEQVPPAISEVPGVEDVGPEFMREVFSLGVGEVGVAHNAPETVYYVVRVTSLTPDLTLLRSIFMAEPFSQYASAWEMDRQATDRRWLEDLRESVGLQWTNPPERLSRG